MCCVDMKFVKKFTSANFLTKECYIQKTHKSRLFMSARTSCTTFVHPSICLSVPILLLLLLLLLPSSHQVTCFRCCNWFTSVTWFTQFIRFAYFTPTGLKNFRCMKTYKINILVLHVFTFYARNRVAFWKNLNSPFYTTAQGLASNVPGKSRDLSPFSVFSRHFCRNFRHLLSFSDFFVQISAVFLSFSEKSAWHRGSQDSPFPRPCDHRSERSRQYSTLVLCIVCFF